MAIISESNLSDLLLAITIIAICIYVFLTSNNDYWQKRGVPYAKPLPLFGNMKDVLLSRKHMIEAFTQIYNELDGHKFGGYFEMRNPCLMVRDPDLAHRILVKDFSHFCDTGLGYDPDNDPLSANLANMEGQEWRHLRYKITPSFSSGKLKGMFQQVSRCGEKLISHIEEQSKIDKVFDGKTLIGIFAMEVIGTCAFGIQMDKENEITKAYREATKIFFKPSKAEALKIAMMIMFPGIVRKLGIKSVVDSLEKATMHIIKQVVHYRKLKKIERNDFLQLLLNLQKEEQSGSLSSIPEVQHGINEMEPSSAGQSEQPINQNNKPVFTDVLIARQSFVFFLAGFETVTAPTSFTLFALAQHPDILQRVYNEIDTVLASHDNKWSYQAVKEMVFLDQVIQETFRKYSVAVCIFRVCTQSYKIPDTNVVIEEGTKVTVPLHAIHNDPKYYPSPETFDPDRFIGNNYKSRGTYMPFGHGPRICIARRFAILEMKVAIGRILSEFSIKLSSKTKLPMTYNVGSYVPLVEGGVWFEFDKRRQNITTNTR